MKQKILAFLLALLLVVGLASSISPAVFAAEERASETEQQRRQKVVDYMYNMCTVAWTPSQTINSAGCSCPHDYTFEAGQTYYGLPYTHKCGSLERMESYIQDGVINTANFPANGYNGWDYLLGNDCADAVFWSWYQISNDISFTFTSDMLSDPAVKPVGNYAFINGDIYTTAAYLSMNQMLEIYAQVQMGDCMLQPGHARLAASNAVVVRNADGSINPHESYILIHEQGGQSREYFNTQHSTCGVNKKETFWDLWMKHHLAVTIDAFANGDDAATATMRQGATSKGGLPLGTISSTGRINFVTIEIYDGEGKVVGSNTVYPCVGSHNTTYTIDAAKLYGDTKDAAGLTLRSGQTFKLFVSDHDGRVEVKVNQAPEHTNHCICGGAAVGMEGHTSCENITWQPLVWDKDNRNIQGNYYLTGDVEIQGGAVGFTGDINICLNGFRLYNGNARLFYSSVIDSQYKLNICDCSAEKSGTVENVSKASTSNGAIVGVAYNSAGSAAALDITLWGGNYVYSCGAARGTGGLFYIHKGSSLKIYNANLVGGRASGDGGLISANNASEVIIYGGTFSGGSATNGGLIRTANGATSLTIKGGTFTDGFAGNYGGLISANGSVEIAGGTFTTGSATYGGLLHLGGNAEITGGYFATGSAILNGGNIIKQGSSATLTISNAMITAGTAGSNGGGVYVDGGTLKVSGAAKIADNLVGEKANNVYLKNDQKLVIDSTGLSDGASIGVTLEAGTGAVADWTDATLVKYFTSDNASHDVCYNSGAVVVGQHGWDAGVATTPAGCETEGEKTYTCGNCNTTRTEVIAVTGHSFGNWIQTKAPTCTEKGEETRSCGTCQKPETREIAALGHTINEWAQIEAPTCTEKGKEGSVCSLCGEGETREIAALGHTINEWAQTKAPTCTAKGEETGACVTCNQPQTREVAAKGHSFGEWTESKAPTCTAKGEETRTCACGEKETREVAAKGHSFGEWTQSKAPTCVAKGEETRTCACGEKETREVDMIDHAMTEKGHDETHHWAVCKVCQHTGTKEAHAYGTTGFCACGAKNPDADPVPPTGDNTSLVALTAMAMMSLFALAAVVVTKRKIAN